MTPACDAQPIRPGRGGGDPDAGAGPAEKGGAGLIRLSVPEIRKLLLGVIWAFVPATEQVLAWSVWRRAHQHRARACHYRNRGAEPPD